MPASQDNITAATPLGATLVPGGATFRAWAPKARAVYIDVTRPSASVARMFEKNERDLLVQDAQGIWSGFVPGVEDGDLYRFYVAGDGSEGFKRDPRARELERDGFPDCDGIVCNPRDYPWHDAGFQPPAFNDLIIYQFHIGVFYAVDDQGRDIRPGRVCTILDVVDRIEYLADLGINAMMPLPFQEYQGENSLGYNGTDLYSPEMDYTVREAELPRYLARVNALLAAKGHAPLTISRLSGQSAQFKAFIDLCHLYGIAVIADVVYNHAGGGFDDQSLYFFDRQATETTNNSLFFTDQGHAGGLVFAYWRREVCDFLIDNGRMLLDEYHIDGLRYDQVTVMTEHGGWSFAQDLTTAIRTAKPTAVQIAEYWDYDPGRRWKGVAARPTGMGFDIGYSDALRDSLREVIRQTTGGRDARIDLNPLRDALAMTYCDSARWTVFQCIENHDLIDDNHTGRDRQPRIAELADPSNPRSWYARSRSKVANGLLLTAPGVPMIFMGQEFLADKHWTDWPKRPDLLIWWEGLNGLDKAMADQHRFTRDILWLRRKQPALRARDSTSSMCTTTIV